MEKTRSYSIIITKTPTGYHAAAPAFTDLVTTARGSRLAYSQLKELITHRLGQLVADGRPIPRDPVVRTRTLRLDLGYIREQEELR